MRNRFVALSLTALSLISSGAYASEPAFRAVTVVVEPSETILSTSSHGVAAGDIDGDGRPDLVVSNEPNGHISILHGNGDGTFRAPRLIAAIGHPYLADIDGDGLLDIVLESFTRRELSVFLNVGHGQFADAVTTADIATFPAGIAITDVDRDGVLDVVVGDSDSRVPGKAQFHILLGNGDGTFRITAPAGLAKLAGAQLVVHADLNGDGKVDIVAGLLSNGFAVLLGNGDGTFRAPQAISAGEAWSLAVADFDRDGVPDLILGTEGAARILAGVGDGTFVPFPNNVFRIDTPIAFVVADLNGDHQPDLAFISYDLMSLGGLPGDGNGHLGATVTFAAGDRPTNMAVADFNGDGLPDIVVAGHDSVTLTVFINTSGKSEPGKHRAVRSH